MLQALGRAAQLQLHLDGQHPQAIFRIAPDLGAGPAAQGFGLLFELAQGEQQAVGQAVGHRAEQQLHRAGAGALTQRRWFIGQQRRGGVVELQQAAVIGLLLQAEADKAGFAHGRGPRGLITAVKQYWTNGA